jgi:hypothetical protein
LDFGFLRTSSINSIAVNAAFSDEEIIVGK